LRSVSGLDVSDISSSDVDDAFNNMISCDVYDGYDCPSLVMIVLDPREAENTADDDGDQASEEEDFVATAKANANKNRVVMVAVGCREYMDI
jgi:hypothetical protein